MLTTFIALNVGATALVARFKGQGNREEADIVAVQSIILTIAMAIVLTIPGLIFAKDMVLFIGAGPDTVEPSTRYFSILMIGFIPTVLPITISALLRGVGETRISMRYNIVANLLNVVFNYILIYGKLGFPAMGVDGAAIASVLGYTVACVMALNAIVGVRSRRAKILAECKSGNTETRRKARIAASLIPSGFIELRFNRTTLKPNFPMIRRIVKIGIPSTMEQLILRVGLMMYVITITSLGTRVFAAHQIVLTILNMSFLNGQAFGIAATSLAGQALGRGDPDQARLASAACQKLGALSSTFMGLAMFVFRWPLIRMFTNESDIIALGVGALIIAAIIQPFQSSFQIYSGALRGAGDTLYPAISLSVGILLIRPALSYLFVHVLELGLMGAWGALAIDQVVRFLVILIHFRKGTWVHTKV
jgi:putative MATE family efflux protein